MQGASGARVVIQERSVLKTASGSVLERLRAQYYWLKNHKTLPVVQVHNIADCGYGMERLCEHARPYAACNLIAPAEKLWTHAAEVELETLHHLKWVRQKMEATPVEFREWFMFPVMDRRDYVIDRQKHLRRCLTHGDLTRVNTMRRDDSPSVLIDPIPATTSCADVWAFDVSKIVVSLLGYEHIVFGWDAPNDDDHLWLNTLLMRCNPVELECVRYMTVVQIARMLPYHAREAHDGLISIADQAICLRP
jgi:hypothetical protein